MLTIVDDRNLGYALGAADYLTKPIDRERLVAVLTQYRRDRPVLVVDDDADAPAAAAAHARAGGLRGGRGGERAGGARAPARACPRASILLDLMMPEMDGFEFVAEFRRHEAWRAIPVVVVTAKDLTREDRERLNGHVERILQKGAHGRERAAGRGARAGGGQRRAPEAPRLMAKILLVEDNEMNRDMLSRRLARRGYEVAIAVDGEQGVAMARAEAPALILMDMSLPGAGRLGGDPPAQGGAGDARHPGHRAHRARDGRRPREGGGGGLRRLRHQARRPRPAAREDRGAAPTGAGA